MRRRPLLSIVLPVAALAVVLASCGAPSGSAAGGGGGGGAPVGPTGRFTIVGRQIVDPNGNVFVPMGANVSVRQGQYETGYTFNWNGTATGRAADVERWGWNTVRATLICDPPPSPTIAQVNAGIDAFIAEYTARGIVVMVECHDVTGESPSPTSPDLVDVYAFWDRLAHRWKDNPYVWFNMFNEPQAGSSPADVENWLALQRSALARLRAIAPHSIFVADIPGYGQAVETFTGPGSILRLGEGQCNVLYSWHAYGALGKNGTFGNGYADFANETASRANHLEALTWLRDRNVPIVIGELGDPLTLNEGSAGQPIWNRIAAHAVMDLAPFFGVGMLWWHATGDSGVFLTYALTADRKAPWAAADTGAGLSTGGHKFWQRSKHRPAPQPFTGNLAASNCG